MPRVNRTEIYASDEIQAFHLVNRCVRRTFLCGKDRRSGEDYSHRKEWIRERLEELAGIFGIDILGFAVLIVKNFPKRFRNEAGLSESRQTFRAARRESMST